LELKAEVYADEIMRMSESGASYANALIILAEIRGLLKNPDRIILNLRDNHRHTTGQIIDNTYGAFPPCKE